MSICIWNAETGTIISGPFKQHTDCVESVAFSQDGTQVVSGSWDKTIYIWDAETGEIISGPFKGHTDCVAFGMQRQEQLFLGHSEDTLAVSQLLHSPKMKAMLSLAHGIIPFAFGMQRLG